LYKNNQFKDSGLKDSTTWLSGQICSAVTGLNPATAGWPEFFEIHSRLSGSVSGRLFKASPRQSHWGDEGGAGLKGAKVGKFRGF
jgi:hypothetical protein